jgi:hypothetical protein
MRDLASGTAAVPTRGMADVMTGGCQCGRIRYEAAIDNDEAYLCHCNMCRKATGGISIAFKSVPLANVRWLGAEPDYYRSSPIAKRPFCATCGTPLGFQFLDGAINMDLTVGSFDDPGYFRPMSNFSIETMAPAWGETAHLSGMRMDENPSTRDRWIKAVGKLPD